MPSLPNRPTTYLLLLLVVILGLLTLWMQKVLTDPAVLRAAEASKAARQSSPAQTPLPSLAPAPAVAQNVKMDAGIASMHTELTQPETPPERELEIIQELLSLQQRGTGGATLGDNGDITRALVGESGQGVWLPRASPRIRDGQLLDRWSSPYWFHPNAANQIEIRSPGPDKELFTKDDIILNGSPAGFGATPAPTE